MQGRIVFCSLGSLGPLALSSCLFLQVSAKSPSGRWLTHPNISNLLHVAPITGRLVFISATFLSPQNMRNWSIDSISQSHKLHPFSPQPHWAPTCALLCLCKNTFPQTSLSLAFPQPHSPLPSFPSGGELRQSVQIGVFTASLLLLFPTIHKGKGFSFTPLLIRQALPLHHTLHIPLDFPFSFTYDDRTAMGEKRRNIKRDIF